MHGVIDIHRRRSCKPCLPVGEGGVQVNERAVHVEGQLAHQSLRVEVLKNILRVAVDMGVRSVWSNRGAARGKGRGVSSFAELHWL